MNDYEIALDLDEVIGLDLEGFLDLISVRAVGNELLMDIDYRIIGIQPDGSLLLAVTGDSSMALDIDA